MLHDQYNRKIDYVRLSLTDRCNFQCFYCRPRLADKEFFPSGDYLNKEDIRKLFLVLGKLGVRKVKLTGGEPLLRKDILDIVATLKDNPDLKDVSLTTNGFFLEKNVHSLKGAGLDRINISLDSLKPERFNTITQTSSFPRVYNGFIKSLDVGYSKVKLNVVLMKGYNDDELFDFLALSQKYPICVRFIEFMPTLRTHSDQKKYFFSNEQALKTIQKRFILIPESESFQTGPAKLYRVKGAPGNVGFISPLSRQFCDSCNRVRISAKGDLRLCLFSTQDLNLLSLIRHDQWGALEKVFKSQFQVKPLRHELKTGEIGNVESFILIGG